MAGVAGFGPTNARVKVWCLTAWLYPIRYSFLTFLLYHKPLAVSRCFPLFFPYIFRAAPPSPSVKARAVALPTLQSKSRPAGECGAACLLGYRQLPAITSVRPVQQQGVRSAHGRESRKRNPGRSGGRTLRTWGRRHARRRYRRAGSCLRDGQE